GLVFEPRVGLLIHTFVAFPPPSASATGSRRITHARRRRQADQSRGVHMARDSGQRFIKRNRPPPCHITYENPNNPKEKIEIPFVMGVMSDLSGNNPGVEREDIANRKFLEFDMDNLDARMAAIQPGVSFKVDNKLADGSGDKIGVNLRFNKMADFDPAAVARQVPALAKLLEAREQLANLQRYMDGKVAAEDTLRKLLADPQLMEAVKNRAAETGSEGQTES